ncbi:uncharacterized protein LOC125228153 [Leguminivora glycinivorella]|uniref:uncharacterized protein LOC125228153 n=1 Tax=Leguminivora glycinivorella TaxID=1035111 RepID=UPI00200FE289|nr:uncharacterized protein LOC125228153 [Leguminivora glycinivorella]
MANIIDVDMDMDTCEPDSTVEIIEVEEETLPEERTPLQALNHELVERQHMCAAMVAASIRDRDRVRTQLVEARKRRASVTTDYLQVMQMSKNATRSLADVKASLKDAMTKRVALLKEIETEKMWRPPSAEMSLKKQQELKERVEHMRAILGMGKIRTPDD